MTFNLSGLNLTLLPDRVISFVDTLSQSSANLNVLDKFLFTTTGSSLVRPGKHGSPLVLSFTPVVVTCGRLYTVGFPAEHSTVQLDFPILYWTADSPRVVVTVFFIFIHVGVNRPTEHT